MDLKNFYQKIRKVEATISEPYVVIVSTQTPDGGKEGTRTEVTKSAAARLVVEGRARLASAEEIAQFRADAAAVKAAAEKAALSARVQVAVVSQQEFESLKGGPRQKS
jgi:hypothetical protein